MTSNNVSVAVRIRPKLQKEEIAMCNICTRVTPGEPQVWLGHDKAFTFDHVFDVNTPQSDIYDNCVRSLVEGCFEGYNATVLAYGQTGSGKTFTMGTGFDVSYPDDQRGIIPRAVKHLFDGIFQRQEEARSNGDAVPEFSITTQFIEIYNEELIDLLCEKGKKNQLIRIHEDIRQGIVLHGVETRTVTSAEDTLQCLKSGSLFRTTGATLMNAESSRSHAIFTLFVKQSRVDRIEPIKEENVKMNGNGPEQELVTLTAKFNFVDLAGSERLSRTGAVGERAKEGISINSGLLHLGNVISALGDRSKKVTHIPYRDSKLTRVLQDSLGGNSVTTMIACISPCDRDFVETLNTLRYANRAKNIKNKVVANQDSQTQLINELRRQLLQLQLENQDLRQGKLFVKNDGEVELNDVYHENKMLQRELNNANIRIKALNTRLEEVNGENIILNERVAKIQMGNYENGVENGEDYAESLIKGYLREISELRSKVVESDLLMSHYRKQLNLRENELNYDNEREETVDVLERAKQELEMGKSCLTQMNMSIASDTNGNHRLSDVNDYDNEEFSGDDEDAEEYYEKKLADHNAELTTLMENLASKEKLIEEFEARERRIIELTEHYEQKISSFRNKIKQIEDERDTLMNKFKSESKNDQNAKQKREEYEKRLARLQTELKKYESLKREHQKVLHQESSSKERLKKMRQEIIEAKQQRVKLIAQMREQMSRHSKEIHKNKQMINKLTREDHKKFVKIRDLEATSTQQKKMLLRREEEIKALRRLVKPMSDRVAGRVNQFKRLPPGNTPQKARNKWSSFENKFKKLVNQKVSFEMEEKKLERYFKERQKAIEIVNTLKENKSDAFNDEYIQDLQNNIDYFTKCIEQTQNMIMQFEDENINISKLFHNLDPDEVMYILEKLASSAIDHAIVSAQRAEELKEKESQISQLYQQYQENSHLLNYMVIEKYDGENAEEMLLNNLELPPAESEKYRRMTMTPSELLYENFQNPVLVPSAIKEEPEEENSKLNGTYLVEKDDTNNTVVKVEKSELKRSPNGELSLDRMTQSLYVEPANNISPTYRKSAFNGASDLNRVESAPSLKDLTSSVASQHSSVALSAAHHYLLSPHLPRRRRDHPPATAPYGHTAYHTHHTSDPPNGVSTLRVASHGSPKTSRMARSTISHNNNNNNCNSHSYAAALMNQTNNNNQQQQYHHQASPQASPSLSARHVFLHSEHYGVDGLHQGSATPPGSPFSSRRLTRETSSMSSSLTQDSDVFSRLTSTNSVLTNQSESSTGQILVNNSLKSDKSFPLSCTHTVVGHRRPVLSVTATNEVLFSGSKDGTAKIWDLNQCQEVFSLNEHPDAVNVVRYDEYHKYIFTCSKSIIKIWDPRENPVTCVKTLCSSGLVMDNNGGDATINDMRLSADGSTLFSTADRLVRVWDMRTFFSVGKLNTSHKSLVTCLAVDEDESNDSRLVITGSKDHTVKVFELEGSMHGIHIPKYTLKPPHYDGIEALRLTDKGRFLFSGGRDGCIKKWDLTEQRIVAALSNCHRDWVLALDTFLQGSILLSACRSGFLRVWTTDTCRSLGEIQAHPAAVNDIATIPQAIFTASSDCTINLWQHRDSAAATLDVEND